MMHTHEGKAALQVEACRAVAFRAPSADNQVLAAGLECIMAAMDGHTGDTEVQDLVCTALREVVFKKTESQIKIAAAGGLKRIIMGILRVKLS